MRVKDKLRLLYEGDRRAHQFRYALLAFDRHAAVHRRDLVRAALAAIESIDVSSAWSFWRTLARAC